MQQQNIEKLFKDSFENFETEVSPQAWENIQNSLETGVRSPESEAKGSELTGSSKQWAVKSITGIVSVAVVGVAAWFYFSSSEKEIIAIETPAQMIEQTTTSQPIAKPLVSEAITSSENNTPKKVNEVVVVPDNKAQTQSREQFSANDEIAAMPSQQTTSFVQHESAKQEPQLAAKVEKPEAGEHPSDGFNPSDGDGEGNFSTDATSAEKNASWELSYPDVITPNGDNKNEVFIIETKNISTLKVIVRDMSGKEIHSWNTLHGFWDGRLGNDEQATPGKYLIDIFATTNQGEAIPRKTVLELIR